MFISNIRLLSTEFYKVYTHEKYPELLLKESRPYLILVIEYKGLRFGIPFRTNIKHRFAYKFKNTGRDTEFSTGLDFSKAVLIKDLKYLGRQGYVDQLERNELNSHYKEIKEKFSYYLNNVIKSLNNEIKDKYFAKQLSSSTLVYFKDDIIGIK